MVSTQNRDSFKRNRDKKLTLVLKIYLARQVLKSKGLYRKHCL